ncbi:type II secretion system protein [Terribacillus saccharophilus]|uniref:PulJ/GspJ family protein n=1 Tax=Terribacillus saccharophilus TaxID=361277 RepID=UPI0039819720
MKKNVCKEQGFTLVEIMVSMTILAIIIIAFVPIFTQAAIHNKVNGNKLKANEAAQVAASDYDEQTDLNLGIQIANLPSCPSTIDEQTLDAERKIGDKSYIVKVNLCNYKTGNVENLVQAVFTTRTIDENPATTGVARKFLTGGDSDAQNP